jgi:rsbT co-antagonist protein RsbR
VSTPEPDPAAQAQEVLALLSLASAKLTAVRDLEALAVALNQIMGRVIPIEYDAIYFLEPETGRMRLYDTIGFDQEDRREAERTAPDRHPGKVLRSGVRLHVPDVEADVLQQQSQTSARKFVVRSRLFLPVISEGRSVGTIGISSSRRNNFSDFHISVLEFACHVAGVVYKNVCDNLELHRQLERVRQQELELRRLSSPVIEVWERVLVLPLIGSMNAERFSLIAESLLLATTEKRAAIVILDLTGLELLRESDTGDLVRLYRAVELLGARCVLSGISAAIASNLTRTGDALHDLQTYSTLRHALASVLAKKK